MRFDNNNRVTLEGFFRSRRKIIIIIGQGSVVEIASFVEVYPPIFSAFPLDALLLLLLCTKIRDIVKGSSEFSPKSFWKRFKFKFPPE
mgnify:CR=1 FL=1